MKLTSQKKFVIPAAVCIAVILFLCYYYFFTAMAGKGGSHFIYIDKDDNIDSVYAQLDTIASQHGMTGFKGCMLFTSHDQELMNTVANRIIEINGTKTFDKNVNYDEYLDLMEGEQ